MNNNTLTNPAVYIPMQELSEYHQQLIEQFSDPKLQVPSNVDTPKLMPFNGYYTLDSAIGAFFAIDTNMVIRPTASAPEYDLSLLISLDGKTSTRFAFTGTFDGTTLLQEWTVGGLNINLTFTRTNSSYGPTVTCKGSIALPNQQAIPVTGNTYNNPIPASLYIGDYYFTPSNSTTPVKVMSIGANNQLMYDNGTNSGTLNPVDTYVYNLNMYYFSIVPDANTKVQLIMGTAATQGFACNNMTIKDNKLITRNLSTIPSGITLTPQLYDLSGVTLADFSGYYQIPTPQHPLAFLSIQAQYVSTGTKKELELNFVMISYSLDGITSTGYFFDPFAGMTFDKTTNTLTVPSSSKQSPLTLTFKQEYNEVTGSLVNITGNIDGTSVTGSTLFNPVPLSVFGGVAMTNSKGDKLIINNDNSITYTSNNITATFDSLIYVPLMYIVAAPADAPTLELSLGTDGLRGNTSIVIEKNEKTTAVYAINGPE